MHVDDRTPTTGWTRDTWVRLADDLLRAVQPYGTPGHGRIYLPGPAGGYGRAVDGLEGFARTFLLAGFRLAGRSGEGLGDLAAWYAAGVEAGTDPDSPERWVRPREHPQAKVEAASLALALDMTRPWLWDHLGSRTQNRVIDYLAEIVGDDTYPRNNWLWFRVCVETFLRCVGGPWSSADIAADLALHDSLIREDGWIADGDGRNFDHYSGWALQLYPTLWQRMAGTHDLADDARREADRDRLDRYLADTVHLVGGDGGPLIQGRSLIYRFAAAAPFWAGAMARVPSVSPGRLRRAATAVVSHFVHRGAPDAAGLLTPGWFGPWPRLAQSYSGPGSPYWAVKGLLGLAIPADDPVWTAPEEPLPIEAGDFVRVIAAPGWIVSGTVADGIVRVVNHGTDHAREGDTTGDSPLYARLGYSTATAPLLDGEAWRVPLESSAGLADAAGRLTHRSGFTPLGVRLLPGGTGYGASLVHAHWLDDDPVQTHHGAGLAGIAEPAGTLLVVSVVRGPWEVRGVRVLNASPAATALLIGGWADAGAGALASLRPLDGAPVREVVRPHASPLADAACVLVAERPVATGAWTWTVVGLSGEDPRLERCEVCDDGASVTITWPDDQVTQAPLPTEAGAR